VTTEPFDYSVVYLSSIDWDFRRQDHQFICLELASRGHDVVYVENTGARMPGPRDLRRVVSRLRNWSRALRATAAAEPVRVVSPIAIPGGALPIERALNKRLLRLQLRPELARLGGRRVLWIGLPTWAAVDLIDIVSPDLIVYYCGDAFAEVPGIRQSLRASEREIVTRSDLVIANSQALVEHCRRLGARDTLFVPVGIDLAASEDARAGRLPAPAELRGLPGRLIGYMGGLNHKVDLPLLEAVADAFPDDTLVVLGSVEDPRYRPRDRRNVVILGERSYDDIGAYLVRFDVCLIPYVVNEFTISVYPGKLVEYLALCRPVVSTPLPEVLPYAPVVDIAATPDAFVAAVAAALERPDTAELRAERLAWASRNSYSGLVATMVGAMEQRLADRTR
jgi:hypothetical protein